MTTVAGFRPPQNFPALTEAGVHPEWMRVGLHHGIKADMYSHME